MVSATPRARATTHEFERGQVRAAHFAGRGIGEELGVGRRVGRSVRDRAVWTEPAHRQLGLPVTRRDVRDGHAVGDDAAEPLRQVHALAILSTDAVTADRVADGCSPVDIVEIDDGTRRDVCGSAAAEDLPRVEKVAVGADVGRRGRLPRVAPGRRRVGAVRVDFYALPRLAELEVLGRVGRELHVEAGFDERRLDADVASAVLKQAGRLPRPSRRRKGAGCIGAVGKGIRHRRVDAAHGQRGREAGRTVERGVRQAADRARRVGVIGIVGRGIVGKGERFCSDRVQELVRPQPDVSAAEPVGRKTDDRTGQKKDGEQHDHFFYTATTEQEGGGKEDPSGRRLPRIPSPRARREPAANPREALCR